MKVYYPPKCPPLTNLTIFLAGTIDQGQSRDWQSEIYSELNKLMPADDLGVSICNPRRPDWDSNWYAEHPELVKQIRWELNQLQRADLILMWFEPNSKSPITLLEMGLFSSNDNLVIGCPDGFYRATNVRETVRFMKNDRYNTVRIVNTWEKFVSVSKQEFKKRYTCQ